MKRLQRSMWAACLVADTPGTPVLPALPSLPVLSGGGPPPVPTSDL